MRRTLRTACQTTKQGMLEGAIDSSRGVALRIHGIQFPVFEVILNQLLRRVFKTFATKPLSLKDVGYKTEKGRLHLLP